MRSMFVADWTVGVVGAIRNVVRSEFPTLEKSWPLLDGGYVVEAFQLSDYFVQVIKDVGVLPSGPGDLQPWLHSDQPALPPTVANSEEWAAYLSQKFSLGGADIAFVLPIHDSGKNDAAADFAMFSDSEKRLFDLQLRAAIKKQRQSIP